MPTLFKVLGYLFLLIGLIWIIAIVTAVARDSDGVTFVSQIPGLAFHAVATFLGMIFLGLGQRAAKAVPQK